MTKKEQFLKWLGSNGVSRDLFNERLLPENGVAFRLNTMNTGYFSNNFFEVEVWEDDDGDDAFIWSNVNYQRADRGTFGIGLTDKAMEVLKAEIEKMNKDKSK